ncbi:cation diffusion facilitator family transporter [Candidatus Saccharibacteria bacterium]|nr:cation diffusion facilitator family transporter [Candidatus Saccharibacteria bacterium]
MERKTKNNRSQVIFKAGFLFILINLLLAIFNIIIGLISNSLAIITDALHSLIDGISGILIIVSEKLANIKRFTNYRNKIERITTIIIAIIIIIVGIDIDIEAIEKIIEPTEVEISAPTIIILIASIIAKLLLALYLKKQGEKEKSSVLTASGAETMNDMIISIAVLASAIIYLIWHVDIEAYISIAISFIILKVGLEFIFPHLSHHHHHPLETNPDHDHCQD